MAYPINLDADDVVAWLAHKAGKRSKVLSADRDMFRYGLENATERVCAGFAFDAKGALVLIPSDTPSCRPGCQPRPVEELAFDDYAMKCWLVNGHRNKLHYLDPQRGYLRGCSCPFVKSHGNLHGHAQPLRAAVYHLLGKTTAVCEDFPEWDDKKKEVSWGPYMVEPNAALAPLLKDPPAALAWLEARDPMASGGSDHPLRAFARVLMVAELVDAAHGVGFFSLGCSLAGNASKEAAKNLPSKLRKYPPFK